MKIYGPYKRRDGRKHICIVHTDGTRQTKSYPRYLMEQHLKRELEVFETVDHINNDFTDDRIENLQILPLSENIQKQHTLKPEQTITFICPQCGKEATKPANFVKANRKKGAKGPYCGRVCAGLASRPNLIFKV